MTDLCTLSVFLILVVLRLFFGGGGSVVCCLFAVSWTSPGAFVDCMHVLDLLFSVANGWYCVR